MDFTLSEEQEILKKTSRSFLTDKYSKTIIREIEQDDKGYSPAIWQEMAGLGWMGIIIPENYGGSGNSFMELAILLEEMGRIGIPSPFFSTVVLGALPILNIGTEKQKQYYLPEIAGGKTIFTMAPTEYNVNYKNGSFKVTAKADNNSYVLNGTKLFVPYAHIANYMLCEAVTASSGSADEEVTIFIVDTKSPGVQSTLLNTFTNNKLCEVVFNDVKVPEENILGKLNKGRDEIQRISEQASVAKCCEMIGGMGAVLEMTVDYTKQRVQFGKPIGSFQSIQNHCANILVDVETSKVITYETVWRLSTGLDYSREASMAKSWVSDAYPRIAKLATQVHGGVSIMADHDMPRYVRHAKSSEIAFGDSRYHRKKLTQEADLAGLLEMCADI